MENLKKREGDAARNRQKQKKLLLESASSCKTIKDMFMKQTNLKSVSFYFLSYLLIIVTCH